MSSGAISLKAFCERFSISDNTAYREIAAGRLLAVKVGRRTLISEQAAGDWWESLQSMKRAKREAA
jgi:excisionase family DNA binding protein